MSTNADKAAAAAARAADPEHRALVDAYKAQGKLDEGHRYEWELPKRLQPRKSKKRDRAAVAEIAPERDITPAYVEESAGVDWLASVADIDSVTELEGVRGEIPAADDDSVLDADPDSIAGHKAELKRLAALKRQVTDEYMALHGADKDTIAFYDKKLKLIESQEKAAMDQLKLFNKKRLDAESAANQVLIIIEPWQGDGTSAVKTWL